MKKDVKIAQLENEKEEISQKVKLQKLELEEEKRLFLLETENMVDQRVEERLGVLQKASEKNEQEKIDFLMEKLIIEKNEIKLSFQAQIDEVKKTRDQHAKQFSTEMQKKDSKIEILEKSLSEANRRFEEAMAQQTSSLDQANSQKANIAKKLSQELALKEDVIISLKTKISFLNENKVRLEDIEALNNTKISRYLSQIEKMKSEFQKEKNEFDEVIESLESRFRGILQARDQKIKFLESENEKLELKLKMIITQFGENNDSSIGQE